jgi:hypothetical protein
MSPRTNNKNQGRLLTSGNGKIAPSLAFPPALDEDVLEGVVDFPVVPAPAHGTNGYRSIVFDQRGRKGASDITLDFPLSIVLIRPAKPKRKGDTFLLVELRREVKNHCKYFVWDGVNAHAIRKWLFVELLKWVVW